MRVTPANADASTFERLTYTKRPLTCESPRLLRSPYGEVHDEHGDADGHDRGEGGDDEDDQEFGQLHERHGIGGMWRLRRVRLIR